MALFVFTSVIMLGLSIFFPFQCLPCISQLFTPAVSCPVCQYANDHTFRFCQNCRYARKTCSGPVPAPVTFDLNAIDRRIHSLQDISSSSAYSKQKQSLKSELERFLYALPGRRSLFNATPWDVRRFLAYKDSSGQTRVHVNGCPSLGQKGPPNCQCPLRLSYSTVDSYIGKLRSILMKWNGRVTGIVPY